VKRWLLRIVLGLLVVFIAIQFVPYGWKHSNPPVIQDAPWPNAESAAIARTSCYSCHSNETDWPIYTYVAPMSWLARKDVDEGRDKLNFSNWPEFSDEADDAVDTIENGSMPLSQYTLIHGDATLTDAEKQILIAALEVMDQGQGGNSGQGGGGGDNSGHGNSDG
jgi:hypothetical protein